MQRLCVRVAFAALVVGCSDGTTPQQEVVCPDAQVALCSAAPHLQDIALVAVKDIGNRIVLGLPDLELRFAFQEDSDELWVALQDGRVSRARQVLADFDARIADLESENLAYLPTLSAIELSLRPAQALVD